MSFIPSLFVLFSHTILFFYADDFSALCGSARPGFVIDIYTGQPIGRLITDLLLYCGTSTYITEVILPILVSFRY